MLYDYKSVSKIKRIKFGDFKGRKPLMSAIEVEELLSGDFIIEEKLDGKGQVFVHDDYVFFVEHMGERHTIHYNKLPCFQIVFDIWDAHSLDWLRYEKKVDVAGNNGFHTVERLQETFGKMDLGVIINHYMKCDIKSAFGDDGIEGIVIKNYDKGLFGKLLRTEFTDQLTVYYRDRNKYMPEKMKLNWYKVD